MKRSEHSAAMELRATGASYAQVAQALGVSRRHAVRLTKPADIEKAKRQIEKAWQNSTHREREAFLAYLNGFIEDREGRCGEP